MKYLLILLIIFSLWILLQSLASIPVNTVTYLVSAKAVSPVAFERNGMTGELPNITVVTLNSPDRAIIRPSHM